MDAKLVAWKKLEHTLWGPHFDLFSKKRHTKHMKKCLRSRVQVDVILKVTLIKEYDGNK